MSAVPDVPTGRLRRKLVDASMTLRGLGLNVRYAIAPSPAFEIRTTFQNGAIKAVRRAVSSAIYVETRTD